MSNQNRMALFAGTTEGRELADELMKKRPEVAVDAFVVSEYGARLLPSYENLHIHVGRLDESDMERLFRKEHYALVVDATHPYAAEVTKNLHRAAENAGIRYLRVRRLDEPLTDQEKACCIGVSSLESAVSYLKQSTGNILLTTGCKELPAFSNIPDFERRVYARMLPTDAAVDAGRKVHLSGRHLILMQGPFSEEMNRVLLKDTDAQILVTKMSGREGGFLEKVKAAKSLHRKVLIILPPEEKEIRDEEVTDERNALSKIGRILHCGTSEIQISVDKSEKQLMKEEKKNTRESNSRQGKIGRKFTVIGMGPGDPALVSDRAIQAILNADTLIGASRMIGMAETLLAQDEAREKHSKAMPNVLISFIPSEIRQYLDDHQEAKNIVLLYSGSIRVYSGASSIDKIAGPGDEIERIDGMSSVDYFKKICHIPEPSQLISVHGREMDAPAAIRANVQKGVRTLVLLGGSKTLQDICQALTQRKNQSERLKVTDTEANQIEKKSELNECIKVTVGERLSYPDQRIRAGRPEDFADADIDSLSIACFENVVCPSVMIAAPKSGSGKTTVTCGLIRALQRRQHRVMSFKCGPDYIDPMFHASTLGVPTGNLDSFFTDEQTLRTVMKKGIQNNAADISVIEGVMGLYDGLGGTSLQASSYEVSRMTGAPIILVVDVRGASLTLVPILEGILQFADEMTANRIQGIILNRASAGFYPTLKKMIEEELAKAGYDIPVLGYLPINPEFAVPSRHLGLVSPSELKERRKWADGIADQMEQTVDLDAIERIAICQSRFSEAVADIDKGKNDVLGLDGSGEVSRKTNEGAGPEVIMSKTPVPVRIAVAKDEAFSFYYSENEDLLRELGAEVIHFSPLRDESFPQNVQGLVLGGGYPELFLEALWKNGTMRHQIRDAVNKGLPTIAECGGFMYLLDELKTADGKVYPMCGSIHGSGYETKKLVRFGYFEAETKREGLYGPKGMYFRGHEFHYWDATVIGDGFHLEKPLGKRNWDEIVYTDTLAAGFPHFYWPGQVEAIQSFLDHCRVY